jgi:hypothetical protein
MKLSSYVFRDKCLHLEFDKCFNEIQIQKLEPIENDARNLDYMSMRLSFSKSKKEIDLQVNEESLYAILIANDQAYHLTRELRGSSPFRRRASLERDQDSGLELIGKGMATLFKEVVPQQDHKIGYGLDQLKNENISAQVKRHRWS